MEDTQGSYVRAAQRTPSNGHTRSLQFVHHTNTRPSTQPVVASPNGGWPKSLPTMSGCPTEQLPRGSQRSQACAHVQDVDGTKHRTPTRPCGTPSALAGGVLHRAFGFGVGGVTPPRLRLLCNPKTETSVSKVTNGMGLPFGASRPSILPLVLSRSTPSCSHGDVAAMLFSQKKKGCSVLPMSSA